MATAYLRIRVTPSARRDRLEGWTGDVLRLRVAAPAERGRANEAVLRLLAKALGVDYQSLRIVRGAAGRNKLVRIEGLDDGEVRRRVGAAGEG
ncbi:MAG: DUF167 domain-containing protein [Chloroflexi bacterium]|nr:DUF167 domain-containing protein [Chloroflexota bacterium]